MLTDVGTKRDTDEDAVLAASIGGQHLLIVADGTGGHAAGDVASDIATTKIKGVITNSLPAEEAEYEVILGNAISEANEEIRTRSTDDSSLFGMGTTVAAALVDGRKSTMINVGDSRCYRINDNI